MLVLHHHGHPLSIKRALCNVAEQLRPVDYNSQNLDWICALAIRTGFGLAANYSLSANNRLSVWRRVEV